MEPLGPFTSRIYRFTSSTSADLRLRGNPFYPFVIAMEMVPCIMVQKLIVLLNIQKTGDSFHDLALYMSIYIYTYMYNIHHVCIIYIYYIIYIYTSYIGRGSWVLTPPSPTVLLIPAKRNDNDLSDSLGRSMTGSRYSAWVPFPLVISGNNGIIMVHNG